MRLDEYLDVQSDDVIRLKGHRLGLEQVVERYHEGYSPEQIALEYPGVSLEQVYGAIAYICTTRPPSTPTSPASMPRRPSASVRGLRRCRRCRSVCGRSSPSGSRKPPPDAGTLSVGRKPHWPDGLR